MKLSSLIPYPTWRVLRRHPLTRERQAAAWWRFVRWQVTSRLQEECVVPFVGDSKLCLRRGMTGATGNVYTGLHEFADMGFLLHLLRGGDLFVDVGANVGSYSVLAAAVVGAEAVACEPVPATVAELRANLRLNGIEERVEVVEAAVAGSAGEAAMTANRGTQNRLVGEAQASTLHPCLAVRTVSLDGLLGERTPTLIKVDVEGHEAAVLRGAQATLTKPGLLALIVELADFAGIAAALGEHGFEPVTYDPLTRELEPARAKSAGERNVIFVRDRAAVLERLQRAQPFEVLGLSV